MKNLILKPKEAVLDNLESYQRPTVKVYEIEVENAVLDASGGTPASYEYGSPWE